MNSKHMAVGLAVLGVVLSAVPFAWADAPGWERTFDDYTFQGMVPFDYFLWAAGAESFFPEVVAPCSGCSPALRLLFTNPTARDRAVGLFTEPSESATMFGITTGGVSAKMLIKFSTSPYTFAIPDTNTFFLALAVNVDRYITADPINNLKGYWVYVGDAGANPNASPPTNHRLELGIQYLAPPDQIDDLCPTVLFDPFDPTKDWWLRAEALEDGVGGILIRGRIWPDDGTPEPEVWDVQVNDSTYNYTSGMVALGAEQRLAGHSPPYTSYVEVDTVSARTVPESICHNNIDDDADGLVDCDDPDCAASAACACPDPFADTDSDGDVDQADFGVFQACLTGGLATVSEACQCFDRDDTNADGLFNPPDDGDGDVDSPDDLGKFERCASGPGIAADRTCDNVND